MKEVIKMNISRKSKKRIGQDIMELRLALGENQKQFATRLNVSQNAVSIWELGKSRPRPEILREISYLWDQMFSENKESDVSILEKEQTEIEPEILNKIRFFSKLFQREILGIKHSIEQYSTEELLSELKRRTLKNGD